MEHKSFGRLFSLSIRGLLGSMLIFQGVFVSGGDKLPALGKIYRHEVFMARRLLSSHLKLIAYVHYINISGFAMICLSASALLESEHVGVNVD